MIQAISHDLDELGFVEGKDYIDGPRNSGRTTRMLRDALLQIPWMDPGDEIFVVASNWAHAKRLCEYAHRLAEEMGIHREKYLSINTHEKNVEGWVASPDGRNTNRYFITFKTNKHIHFLTVEDMEHSLLGRRLSHDPAFFIDHVCYEFGFIQNASCDLYALLSNMV